ncbi:MAG: hypothetical protein VX949_08220 [Planctomycetota bacterium]|nr:hypothetical protein [Planctomycetota bacterium]
MRGWRRIRDRISILLRIARRWIGHPDLRSLERRVERLQGDSERLLLRLHPGVQSTPSASGQEEVDLKRIEASRFSQNGEDGVLLHILSEVGAVDHNIVEIGCGEGIECNSALLVCCFGWNGLLVDRDGSELENAGAFFRSRGASDRVQLLEKEVLPDAVDQLIPAADLDVLSIDVDGFDFWIWREMTRCRPRIVIVEVNASFGPEACCTVPWQRGDSNHDRYRSHFRGWHHGASLRAMEALGRSKGYRLVAVESTGTNAFFVREDLAPDSLPALDPASAWRPHGVRSRRHPAASQAQALAALPVTTVSEDGEV